VERKQTKKVNVEHKGYSKGKRRRKWPLRLSNRLAITREFAIKCIHIIVDSSWNSRDRANAVRLTAIIVNCLASEKRTYLQLWHRSVRQQENSGTAVRKFPLLVRKQRRGTYEADYRRQHQDADQYHRAGVQINNVHLKHKWETQTLRRIGEESEHFRIRSATRKLSWCRSLVDFSERLDYVRRFDSRRCIKLHCVTTSSPMTSWPRHSRSTSSNQWIHQRTQAWMPCSSKVMIMSERSCLLYQPLMADFLCTTSS